MDHKLFRSKISEYMDKKLSAKELAEFDTHAKACPECLLELQMTVKAVKELKRTGAKEQDLPVNFYAKLGQKLDAADEEKQKRKSFIYTPWFRATAMSFALILIAVMVRQITKSPEFMGNKVFDKGMQQEAEMAAAPAEAAPSGSGGMQAQADGDVLKKSEYKEEKKPVYDVVKAKAAAPARMAMKNEGTALKDIAQEEKAAVEPSTKQAVKAKTDSSDKLNAALQEIAVPATSAPAGEDVMSSQRSLAMDNRVSFSVKAGYKMEVDQWDAKSNEAKKYYEGTQSGVETFQALTFTDVRTWNQFIMKYPALNNVTVDFNNDMIVSVFLGAKPTAGYNVMITDAFYEGDKVLVKYVVAEPNKGTIQAQVITTPYSIKVVKKSTLRVEFERQ